MLYNGLLLRWLAAIADGISAGCAHINIVLETVSLVGMVVEYEVLSASCDVESGRERNKCRQVLSEADLFIYVRAVACFWGAIVWELSTDLPAAVAK